MLNIVVKSFGIYFPRWWWSPECLSFENSIRRAAWLSWLLSARAVWVDLIVKSMLTFVDQSTLTDQGTVHFVTIFMLCHLILISPPHFRVDCFVSCLDTCQSESKFLVDVSLCMPSLVVLKWFVLQRLLISWGDGAKTFQWLLLACSGKSIPLCFKGSRCWMKLAVSNFGVEMFDKKIITLVSEPWSEGVMLTCGERLGRAVGLNWKVVFKGALRPRSGSERLLLLALWRSLK